MTRLETHQLLRHYKRTLVLESLLPAEFFSHYAGICWPRDVREVAMDELACSHPELCRRGGFVIRRRAAPLCPLRCCRSDTLAEGVFSSPTRLLINMSRDIEYARA